MKGLKRPLRLFLIITACLAIFCFVTPVYASALDTLDLQLPFGELPASLTITGSTLGEYVKAVFLFGSAMLFAVAVVAIMYGGVLWTISGAVPNQIDVAKRTILQAIVGIFIASFAIFVLQIVSPGTILLQPISPTTIQGIKCCQVGTTNFQLMTASECNAKKGKIVSDGSCAGELRDLSFQVSKCTEDMSKPCGTKYTDTSANECVGKDCSASPANPVCTSTGLNWSCGQCRAKDADCQDDRECCSAKCEANKCTDASAAACSLGQTCTKEPDTCKGGLICQTNWGNQCMYGKAGSPCSNDNECLSPNFYCAGDTSLTVSWSVFSQLWNAATTRNQCMPIATWARCDPNTPHCPTGTTCKDPCLCNEDAENGVPGMQDAYKSYGCKNDVAELIGCDNTGVSLCVPNDLKCVCNCDEPAECQGVNYNGVAANICNTNGDSFCSPGTYGAACNNNNECKSKMCNTKARNVCTQGAVGEACADDSECGAGTKCHSDAHVCTYPQTMECP